MRVYVEAYDGEDTQILGNLDGQTVIDAKIYKRTQAYKALQHRKTLRSCVKYYLIVSEGGAVLERVNNLTWGLR